MKIIYSPNYNIDAMGFDERHPFDAKKYGRAWKMLEDRFGDALQNYLVPVSKPVDVKALNTVHKLEYLESLKSSPNIAEVIEIGALSFVPPDVLDKALLAPMRWACMGSVVGALQAMRHQLAVNMGGGFHHASAWRGHGFCYYSDIALAINVLKKTKGIEGNGSIAYIDLDAHQGDGVCHFFMDDPSVRIFDIYNQDKFPNDVDAKNRIDHPVPLAGGTSSDEYLRVLTNELPTFLDRSADEGELQFALYNAGSDIYEGDALGGLMVSESDVVKRDLFVIQQLQKRGIPTLMVLSGGYSEASHRMIADSITEMIKQGM